MKFLVLGGGKMGHALVFDLIRSPKVEQVVVADREVARVEHLRHTLIDEKIIPVELDATDEQFVGELMQKADVTVSCLPFHKNYDLAKLALHYKSHFCDLGGNEETVKRTFLLDEVAKEQGVTIMPDLGLAPGLVSMLAEAAAQSMDELYEIRMRVGGLPVEPEDKPLQYCQVFSVDGLVNEYIEDCTVIRDGQLMMVDALADLETVEFPKPIGKLEAFNTSGGASTLPKSYRGKVQHLDYKTIRYPGHCEQIRMMRDLGLFEKEPIELPSGVKVSPRELMIERLGSRLPKDEPDVVIIRVTVTGVKDKRPIQHVWDCIDYGDEANKISAMAKMTVFPVSIIAQMIARGDITERGVLSQEKVVPTKLFLAELASRGISLTMTERSPVHDNNSH